MTDVLLKPCPFCGGKAGFYEDASYTRVYVRCEGCRTRSDLCSDKWGAAAAWNRRARPEERDTWARIDRDLTAHAVAYLLERGLMSEDEVREFDAAEREEAVRRDLVRRAKELAGKEAADE